jgi:outer membrane protein insertion porin family
MPVDLSFRSGPSGDAAATAAATAAVTARRRPRRSGRLVGAGLGLAVALGLGPLLPSPTGTALRAQDAGVIGRCSAPDSIAVRGNERVDDAQIRAAAGLSTGSLSFPALARAIKALYATTQFDNVAVSCDLATVPDRVLLVIEVDERPILGDVTVSGVDALSERSVRDRVELLIGRPLDPAVVARSRSRIDSLYEKAGYYLATVTPDTTVLPDGRLAVDFRIEEGRRLAISGIEVVGVDGVDPESVVGAMDTKREGFWWFRNGEFDEDRFAGDLGDRIPSLYSHLGYIDMRVVDDTLLVDPERGKGKLRITVDEGPQYRIGSFGIAGNRAFTTEQLELYYPFGEIGPSLAERVTSFIFRREEAPEGVFDEAAWLKATEEVQTAYRNIGYLGVQVIPVVERRMTTDSVAVVDLRWEIAEGAPSIVNRVEILGNDYTTDDCIRRAIFIVPGAPFNQDQLINSYQQIQNLGFFESPMPFPEPRPINDEGDVDIIFRVDEKRTGSINFGASMGQGGVGFGGFVGVDQPNLFGQCKRGSLQWQYGRFFNNFTMSYQDPALRGSRTSGTISLYRTQSQFIVGNLGQNVATGGFLRFGFPVPWSYQAVIDATYRAETATFLGAQGNLGCGDNCFRSSLGLGYTNDTRIGQPFPFAGVLRRLDVEWSGGPLGGQVGFQRVTGEYRARAPLATFGGKAPGSQPVYLSVGISANGGTLFGDAGPFFFQQQFAVGGVMFGQPLRGYPEFSITPLGFNPTTGQFSSDPESFGNAFMTVTADVSLRVNSMISASAFFDAGNNWASAREFNPTRLFRSAGFGVSTVTPLGPLGLDFAYGFDRTTIDPLTLRVRPDPRWQFHFRLGQLF